MVIPIYSPKSYPDIPDPVASPTADPGIARLILTHSNTVAEIDNEIISTVILQGGVVSYKRKYEHEVLVNRSSSLPRKNG